MSPFIAKLPPVWSGRPYSPELNCVENAFGPMITES